MSLKLMSFNIPIITYDKHKRDWMNKSKSLKCLQKMNPKALEDI